MDFRTESVAALAGRVAAREVSARELTAAALARIDAVNDSVNAFVAVDDEAAFEAADAVDAAVAAGSVAGPLAGIPIGVKDLEDAIGFVTTSGSATRAGASPATSDSALVARLRAAGCIVVGKTNTPEFGWKGDTVNPVFGATHNPWSLPHSAGGSSGGSAAAVAAGMVPLATGSDGGGSIRIPSALCGLSGMKPSLGRVPLWGAAPPGWADLSTRGPMALRIRDVTLALDAVVGPEQEDLRSLPMPDTAWLPSLASPGPPLRVAWSPTLGYASVDVEVRAVCEAALSVLEGLGTEIVVVDDVFESDPVFDWYTITSTFNQRTLEPFRDTSVWDSIDPGLVATADWAASSVRGLDLALAEDACHRLNARLVSLFHRAPLLLTPVCAGQTPLVGESGAINGTPDSNWIRFTYPFNLTRSPAGCVCAGLTAAGLPVGLQVVGPQHADVAVLRLLALLEDALGVFVAPLP